MARMRIPYQMHPTVTYRYNPISTWTLSSSVSLIRIKSFLLYSRQHPIVRSIHKHINTNNFNHFSVAPFALHRKPHAEHFIIINSDHILYFSWHKRSIRGSRIYIYIYIRANEQEMLLTYRSIAKPIRSLIQKLSACRRRRRWAVGCQDNTSIEDINQQQQKMWNAHLRKPKGNHIFNENVNRAPHQSVISSSLPLDPTAVRYARCKWVE